MLCPYTGGLCYARCVRQGLRQCPFDGAADVTLQIFVRGFFKGGVRRQLRFVIRGPCLGLRMCWSVCRGGLQAALLSGAARRLRRGAFSGGRGRAEARPYTCSGVSLNAGSFQRSESRENHFAKCGGIFAQHPLRELLARCAYFLGGL